MQKSKSSEHQIITILKEVVAGRTVKDVCCEHEISEATYLRFSSRGIEGSVDADAEA
jgi:putative transposase